MVVNGVDYLKIDDAGLHTLVNGKEHLFEVDTVIVRRPDLFAQPARRTRKARRARRWSAALMKASELDAKRAIDQAHAARGGGVSIEAGRTGTRCAR